MAAAVRSTPKLVSPARPEGMFAVRAGLRVTRFGVPSVPGDYLSSSSQLRVSLLPRMWHPRDRKKATHCFQAFGQQEFRANEGGSIMAAEKEQGSTQQPTRLFSCFLAAAEDGPDTNAIMLCEVIGQEIQSISLRVAADIMPVRPLEGNA